MLQAYAFCVHSYIQVFLNLYDAKLCFKRPIADCSGALAKRLTSAAVLYFDHYRLKNQSVNYSVSNLG